MWSPSAITVSRFARMRVRSTRSHHPLSPHQSVVTVKVDYQLAEDAARERDIVGDPCVHCLPAFDDVRIVQTVPKLQIVEDIIVHRLQGPRAVVDHLCQHVADWPELYPHQKIARRPTWQM